MSKSNEITSSMTTPQALAVCARELRELKGFTAVDYEEMEERYGRLDGKPIDQEANPYPEHAETEDLLGEFCAKCPVLKELGECSIRPQLQQLAAEQRATYELATGGGPGNLNSGHLGGIDGWYDSGWRQTD